ncbi:MAG: hypothetical protein K1X81_07410 [Bacteroidia bacterium]|nr:hypothetical protein [Bacteroidia bacterium]
MFRLGCFVILLFLALIGEVNAQDFIIRKRLNTTDTIRAVIIKVSSNSIVYRNWPAFSDGSIRHISKSGVIKIIYQNGAVIRMDENSLNQVKKDKEIFRGSTVLKIGVLAPANSMIAFACEHLIEQGKSVVIGLHLIAYPPSAVLWESHSGMGCVLDFGFNYYINRNITLAASKPVQGFYIGPQFFMEYSRFSSEVFVIDVSKGIFGSRFTDQRQLMAAGVMAQLGYQRMVKRRLVFNIEVASGIGIVSDQLLINGYPNPGPSTSLTHDRNYGLANGFAVISPSLGSGLKPVISGQFQFGLLLGKMKALN